MCLNDVNCESLMDSGVACLALVATPVWYPLVLVGLPWSLAFSLLLCFPMKSLFNGVPIVLEIDMGFSHECCLLAVPLVECLGGPSPFMEISKSGCHWALDMVPLVWFSPEVVPNGEPCLFHMLDVICGPVVDEGVQCPDVVDDHLVVDDVLQPSLMQPEVGGKTLAQCQTIPGCSGR